MLDRQPEPTPCSDTALPHRPHDELRAPGPLRLYQAIVAERWVLLRGADPRNADGVDTRVEVSLPPTLQPIAEQLRTTGEPAGGTRAAIADP